MNPALVLEPMERRIEGPLPDLQRVLRYLLNALRNAPSMHGLKGQCPQDEQIERPLKQIGGHLHLGTQQENEAISCRMSRGRIQVMLADVDLLHLTDAFGRLLQQ